MRVLILLSIFVLTLHATQDTGVNFTNPNKNPESPNVRSNFTGTISDYFANNTLLTTITERWNNFSNSIYEFFLHKHPKSFSADDLYNQMIDFNRRISDYFQANMPGENYTDLLDRFSDRISYYMRRGGMKNETLNAFYDKFYDFSANITDWLNSGFYDRADTRSITDKFSNFLNRIGDYFESNYTDFNKYVEDCKAGKCPEICPECNYQYVYQYIKWYKKPHKTTTRNCNSDMLDKCGHKCMEKKKVLCDCYVIKEEQVDCVCSDSLAMCDLKHTHTDM